MSVVPRHVQNQFDMSRTPIFASMVSDSQFQQTAYELMTGRSAIADEHDLWRAPYPLEHNSGPFSRTNYTSQFDQCPQCDPHRLVYQIEHARHTQLVVFSPSRTAGSNSSPIPAARTRSTGSTKKSRRNPRNHH